VRQETSKCDTVLILYVRCFFLLLIDLNLTPASEREPEEFQKLSEVITIAELNRNLTATKSQSYLKSKIL